MKDPDARAARLGGFFTRPPFLYRRPKALEWALEIPRTSPFSYSLLHFIFRFRSSVHALTHQTSRNHFPIGREVTTYCSFVSGFVTLADFVSRSHLISYCLLCLLCGPTSSSSYRSYILPRQFPFSFVPPILRFAFLFCIFVIASSRFHVHASTQSTCEYRTRCSVQPPFGDPTRALNFCHGSSIGNVPSKAVEAIRRESRRQ